MLIINNSFLDSFSMFIFETGLVIEKLNTNQVNDCN